MSVASIALENLNLAIDENQLFTIPNITVNKGGQIIAISDGATEDNITIQTIALLTDTDNVLNGVSTVLGHLEPQVSEIATQINTLEGQTNTLIANVDILLTQVETLIDQITIASTGSTAIVSFYDVPLAVAAMANLNVEGGVSYLKRRQKLSFTNVTLPAGIYIVNHNFSISNVLVNGISTEFNDSTRFLLTYAFCDVTNGGNICSAVNACSGHDALAICHASSMCFQLSAQTEVNIGMAFDVDPIDTSTWNDVTYSFVTFQVQMYPKLTAGGSPNDQYLNDNIIQVIRIA